LGKQDVTLTPAQLRAVARRMDVALPRAEVLDVWASDGPLDDATLLKALGFASVDSMDVSGYEGATILHDLNAPSIPPALENRFDVVFDRGTAEHVFNAPNTLAAVARMCAPGGRAMHLSPSTNHMDHGFVMFSPRLFADYYTANGFVVERIEMARQPWLGRHPTIHLSRYVPGCLDGWEPGALGEGGYQVLVVARKTSGATHDRWPRFAEGAACGVGLSPVLRFTVPGAGPGRR